MFRVFLDMGLLGLIYIGIWYIEAYRGQNSGIGGSRGRQGVLTPTVKSQVSIGFLRNSGTDPLREAVGPVRSLEGGPYTCTALFEIRL